LIGELKSGGPEGWFGGSNALRSKLPLVSQYIVRELRRELEKSRRARHLFHLDALGGSRLRQLGSWLYSTKRNYGLPSVATDGKRGSQG